MQYFIKDYFLLLSFNNISNQNCLDKPGFINVNRLNHSSPMNSAVTKKLKRLPQLLALGPQIPLKLEWHHFPP